MKRDSMKKLILLLIASLGTSVFALEAIPRFEPGEYTLQKNNAYPDFCDAAVSPRIIANKDDTQSLEVGARNVFLWANHSTNVVNGACSESGTQVIRQIRSNTRSNISTTRLILEFHTECTDKSSAPAQRITLSLKGKEIDLEVQEMFKNKAGRWIAEDYVKSGYLCVWLAK